MAKRKQNESAQEASNTGRKRTRARTDDRPHHAGNVPVEHQATAQPLPVQADAPTGETRQEQMAAIARRRAAHFAHFQAEEEEQDPDNAHVGGTEARELGPWSSARQLVEARAKAAADRADKVRGKPNMGEGDTTNNIQVDWSPYRDIKLGPPPVQRVTPLVSMLLRLLTDNIEDVESLWGLPDVLRVRLAAAVCERRKLNLEAAKLFVEGLPGEVVLPDCTQLEESHLVSLLSESTSNSCTSITSPAPHLACVKANLDRGRQHLQAYAGKLEFLDLRQCGRGMGDSAAAALQPSGSPEPSLPKLRLLGLSGAYRLTDEALAGILKGTPALAELHLPNCSRLQGSALLAMPSLVPGLRVLNLANCRGVSAQCLRGALTASPGLPKLHTLTLDGLPELSDQLLCDLALSLPQLTRLSIYRCGAVTNIGMRGLAAACPGLQGLQLGDVARITDLGLLALAESCMKLEDLSLTRCQKVTDAPLMAMASHRCMQRLCLNNVVAITDATIVALATHCRDTLQELDLSWCRAVSSRALGMLADAAHNLRTVCLFGCTQVDATFLQGHSNPRLQVIGAPAQKTSLPSMAKAELIVPADG